MRTWLKEHQKTVTWIVIVITTLSYVVLGLLRTSRTVGFLAGSNNRNVLYIAELRQTLYVALILILIISTLAYVSIAILRIMSKQYRSFIMSLFFLMLLVPISLVAHHCRNAFTWKRIDRHEGSGTSYYLMRSSALQGDTICMAVIKENMIFERIMETVSCSHGGHPHESILLIRDAADSDAVNVKLRLKACGDYIVAIKSGNQCILAYDTKRREKYSDENIGRLSSFICIGKEAVLNNEDTTILRSVIIDDRNYADTIKNHEGIRKGLTHTNGQVRKLSTELLRL